MRDRRVKFACKINRFIIVIEIQGLNQQDNAEIVLAKKKELAIKTDIHTGTATHSYISDHQCCKLKGDSEFR